MFRLLATFALFGLSILGAVPAGAQAAPGCQFILGFKTLHDLDAGDIGDCTDNQVFAANGDAQQHTVAGLMAWRKADNWTAFTNGYWTWINGPSGLAKRLNTQRFSWEANPTGLPLAGNGSAATAAPLPAPAPAPAGPSVAFSDQGLAIMSGAKIVNEDGQAGLLAFVQNTTNQAISAIIEGVIADSSGNVLGKAEGAVNDLQPKETRLVSFISQVSYAQASKVGWQIGAALPGTALPTKFSLSSVQPDPSSPGLLLVTVQNNDSTTHSAVIGVAITDANGGIVDLAVGAANDLAPGQSKVVDCLSRLDSIPSGSHLQGQIDTAL
jgi:hypothetical protein